MVCVHVQLEVALLAAQQQRVEALRLVQQVHMHSSARATQSA